MDQLGDHHHLHKGLATMLALIALHLLSIIVVGGFLEVFGLDELHGIGAAFLTGTELCKLAAFFLGHHHMASQTPVGLKLQSPQLAFHHMCLGQDKFRIRLHRRIACGTLAFYAFIHLFLEDDFIYPAQPWCHPHRYFVGIVVQRCLVDRLGTDGGRSQLFGNLQDAMVMTEANPSEIERQSDQERPKARTLCSKVWEK